MSSSIPVLACSYSVNKNVATNDSVILEVSEAGDINQFYIQTSRYLMSSSIPVLVRSYSVILVVSEAGDTTYKP